MYRKKVILLFVLWFYANTVNGSPISLASQIKSKCVDSCKMTTTEWSQIEDNQRNKQQATDLSQSNGPNIFEPVFLKRKKRQDNAKLDAESTPELGSVPVDAKQSADPSLPKTGSVDESDLTKSIEYKKAQENLLSASEIVKDGPVSSEAENSPEIQGSTKSELVSDDNKQAPADTQDVDNIQKGPDSLDTISLPNKPQLNSGDGAEANSFPTEILKESTGTESVAADASQGESVDKVESDNLIAALDSAISIPGPTEIKSEADNVKPDDKDKGDLIEANKEAKTNNDGGSADSKTEAIDNSKSPVDSGEIKENTPASESSNESTKPKLNDKAPVKSGEEVKGDTLVTEEDSAAKTYNDGGSADSKTEAIDNSKAPVDSGEIKENTPASESSNESTKPKLNDKAPVKSGEEVKGDTLVTEEDSANAAKTNNDGGSAETKTEVIDNSKASGDSNEKTENKLNAVNQEPVSGKGETTTIPKISEESTGAAADTVKTPIESDLTVPVDEKITITDFSEHQTAKLDSATETSTAPKTDSTNVGSHSYDFDDLDERMIDEIIGETCNCETTGEVDKNILNSLRPASTQYFTKYDNMMENRGDNIQYGPHTYDTSRHFEFFGEFDPEKDLDDLFDADIEFNNQKRDNTAPCDDDFDEDEHEHEDEDDFDDDFAED